MADPEPRRPALGRVAVGAGAHPSSATAVPSVADRLYTAIKADIVAGVVQAGGMVDETSLARAYGVSRTPIREAFRRLEQDGLVVTIPRRGTFVVAPTIQDMREIHEVRMALEPLAARLATGRIDDDALDRIEAGIVSLRVADRGQLADALIRYLDYDSQLHDAVLEAAGNRQLANIVRLLHDRLGAVRRLTAESDLDAAITDVLPLLHALRLADPDAASEAMRRHLEAAETRRRQLV